MEYGNYELVIGLEVHAQLATHSKIFAPDINFFGALPNTHTSYITMAHPGTLPFLNEKVAELAVKAGIATNCNIRPYNQFSRKNYFYPDLPKGYQISQYDTPICYDGYIEIKDEQQNLKKINIQRIHLEEDAGKSIHDQNENYSLIDLNRAGTPLIEIVTYPCIHSANEAVLYVTELRKILQYTQVCDGNMEEGSLRCDVNISVRLKGQSTLNERTEIKNLNSIKNIRRAIEFEAQRQINALQNNEKIQQETRSFDAHAGITFSLRQKEEAHDYRYFPEPDLPPLVITPAFIQALKAEMPELPHQLLQKYTQAPYFLSEYDAHLLTESRPFSQYFETLTQHTIHYKAAANWMLGAIKFFLNEHNIAITEFMIAPIKIAEIIELIENKQISHTAATHQLFSALTQNPHANPTQLAQNLNLIMQSNTSSLQAWVSEVLQKYPDKVKEYKKGKKGLLAMFVGEIMKLSKGKANPQAINELLLEQLQQ